LVEVFLIGSRDAPQTTPALCVFIENAIGHTAKDKSRLAQGEFAERHRSGASPPHDGDAEI
jgi:hypothetical protein